MEKNEDIQIISKEHYGHCFACDRKKVEFERRPKGIVEIYNIEDNNKDLVFKSSNLVVYKGREFVAQRIVGVNNPNVDSTSNEIIAWLGLGSGGVSPSDPLDPIPPILTDQNLYSEVPIAAIGSTLGDFRGGFYYKKPFDSVTFEQDSLNDDRWLVIRITSTLDTNESNGYQLSEAGLFTAYSGLSGPFHLFARITFPVILKTASRRISFVWYLFV